MIKIMHALGLATSLMALAALAATARDPAPALRYDAPPGFSRSAITPPDDYSSNDVNAVLQVYPFRRFQGDIEQMLRRTLLREWIDPRFQETNVAAPAEFKRTEVLGAQLVLTARFVENVGGAARQHQRMVIVAGDSAAVIDASAASLASWQRILPALNAFSATLRVEALTATAEAAAAPAGTMGRAVAGLYMARTMKDAVDMSRGVGFNMTRVPALHFYLLSADGRVYRAYDELAVPGGDAGRFDFDAARRADPINSGRYTVEGNSLRIQMGPPQPQTIIAPAPVRGRLHISGVEYERQ